MDTGARVKVMQSSEQLEGTSVSPVGGLLKRGFDFLFSAVALVALLPLMGIIALLLRMFSRGPVFFVHQRIGFGGKPFGCLKFRTMVADADVRLERLLATSDAARYEFEETRKLKQDPRIIPVIGSFLRSTSLDELPQFLNVLLGQMSVVGPRPVTAEEFERYGV
ncbi:MAG: sugar transferase, partial [Silicimonas sp.]|nr:sugar transferase [Silicimonas sp.]